MNFLNDLIKIRTIFFLILICYLHGKPVLSNDFLSHFPLKSNSFPLPAGLSNNPINDLTFDNNGIMYVSSGNAVHIGNGITWKKINTNDPPFLTAGTKNVYLYTNNDAGIITSDSTGQFIFNSYRNLFEKQSITLANVEDLAAFQGTVYLKAGSKLFLIKENTISVEDTDFEAGKIFNTKNNIIIYKPESGFRKIGINNSSEFVKHNFKPDFLLEHPEGYLAYAKDDNQFIMLSPDLMHVYEWQPEMKEIIAFADNSDDYFFFYSEDNKLFIHSSKGKKESLTGGMVVSQEAILPPLYLEWWAIIVYILTFFLLGFIFYKHFKIKEFRTTGLTKGNVSELVTKEMPKSELFSESIKPSPSDKSKWDKFEIVTVLFSDIQGFTKIAEQMNPEKLIDELDIFFFHFDSVCEKYDIEKIKTIGDAYMAAGGIPRQNSTNPVEVVLVALEMQNYMKQLKTSRTDIWDLRIGIHSGPLIGGVIGYKKRSYDIWGDTVNTASRMESSGEPGKVNISEITYHLIKDFFICEYRGKLPVKYKGNIAMYFVKGLRPELSINLGAMPNRLFFLKLQSLRLKDLEDIIFERLRKELPENLHFHTFDYIKHIYDHACLLSNAESLNAEDSILIRTSALFLFCGLSTNYHNFQNKSAEITREMLPGYKYSAKQINVVCNLILFSKLPHEPQNYLEKIIYDLKTEHYNRADFLKLYKLHFLEVVENSEKITIQEWKQDQIRFLKKHNFYTLSAQRLSEIPSDTQIKKIESDEWE